MTTEEQLAIIELVKHEVVPAIGCTEPAAVALAVAKAREVLGKMPDRIEVQLSRNMLKNAMGVGIPGTGMVGLPIAVALGALIGKSTYGLEVLRDVTPKAVEEGKDLIGRDIMSFEVQEPETEKVFVQVTCVADGHKSLVRITGEHNHFSYVAIDGVVLSHDECGQVEKTPLCHTPLSFQKVCDVALEAPVGQLKFILDAAKMNGEAADQSRHGNYGHAVANVVGASAHSFIMGDSIHTRMMAVTSAACDVRMAGAMVPVMSNSGSGNQGIAATLPVAVFARETGKSDDELARALFLSHLMLIYIKQNLGRLSPLCGAVMATTGAACGITYLMGGSCEQISFAIKNMIGNVTGVICDGAKPSCALKVSTGVSTATISAMMAMENKVVSSIEGIADEDVDKTIQNLASIGTEGMVETDKLILKIMQAK
ncbi:MAG: L-serine ammonia-lyase, iron-sulfur-dependent, subunit alpha [Breznakibacter sp.]